MHNIYEMQVMLSLLLINIVHGSIKAFVFVGTQRGERLTQPSTPHPPSPWSIRIRLYWLDPAMPRLSDDNVPPEPTAALRYCEARLREALLLLAATRLFNQLYERNTRWGKGKMTPTLHGWRESDEVDMKAVRFTTGLLTRPRV